MGGQEPRGLQAQDRHQAPLTMDGEVEVAAVKFVLGGHLTAVATSRAGLGISDVQLKQVDLWGRVTQETGARRYCPSPLKQTGSGNAYQPSHASRVS